MFGRLTSLGITDGRQRVWGCNCGSSNGLLLQQLRRYRSSGLSSVSDLISVRYRYVFKWKNYRNNFRGIRSSIEEFRQHFSVQLARVMVCVMLVVSVSSTFGDTPSCEFNFHIESTCEQ